MSDFETVLKMEQENRNTNTLKMIYDRSRNDSRDGVLRERWAEVAHRLIDRVATELFRHPAYQVMILPASLVTLPDNGIGPVVAKTSMIVALDIREDGTIDENAAFHYLARHYLNLLISRADQIAQVIALYDLFIPTDVVVDPQSNQQRVGIMTRYGVYYE
jgi:hypothetical protein